MSKELQSFLEYILTIYNIGEIYDIPEEFMGDLTYFKVKNKLSYYHLESKYKENIEKLEQISEIKAFRDLQQKMRYHLCFIMFRGGDL